MSVNGISNATPNYNATTKSATNSAVAKTSTKDNSENKAQASTDTKSNASEHAAVYESTQSTTDNNTKKTKYTRDTTTIDQLKAEAEKKTQQFRDLVQKLLLKQGQTLTESTDIYQLLREGKLEVDPETAAQAQKDVAEDGYWGVNQTSDRLVSFATALAGGDPSKADLMIDAFKKGFEEATKAWGDTLPDLCQKTYDATIKKLEDWKNGTSTN